MRTRRGYRSVALGCMGVILFGLIVAKVSGPRALWASDLDAVGIGMTRDEVYAILGQPEPSVVPPAANRPEFWPVLDGYVVASLGRDGISQDKVAMTSSVFGMTVARLRRAIGH
jgi:hypothetical protein